MRWAKGAMRPIKKTHARLWKAAGDVAEILFWNRQRKKARDNWRRRKEAAKKSIWK